jgi:hypothetical protein
MRKLVFWIVMMLFSVAVFGQGNACYTSSSCAGNISAAGTDPADYVLLQLPPDTATAAVQLKGTFSATVAFEQSADGGTTWVSASGTSTAGGSTVTSATAAGIWRFSVAGITYFRVRGSVYSTGPVGVIINSSKGSVGTGTSPGGTAGGDLTGSFPNPTVAGINGAAVPASKGALASNSSSQLIVSGQAGDPTDAGADKTGVIGSSTAINSTIAAWTGGKVLLPKGTYNIDAQIVFHVINTTLDCQGSTLVMNLANDGIYMGSSSNPTLYGHNRLLNCVIEPGTGSSSYSAVVANGQGNFINVHFSANGANRFAYGIKNLDDQALIIEHPVSDAAAIFTASAIYQPGPYATNAGITHIRNPELNLGCTGDGVDYLNGNGLDIQGGFIQAYARFAVRANANTVQTNVHEEHGNCTNPIGNIGAAGNIQIGGSLTSIGKSPSALAVAFTVNGTPGTTNHVYWIAATEIATGRVSIPLPIGYVRTGNAVIDGTNNNTVTWPDSTVSGITGATYKVIRKVQDLLPPIGTGNWLVATGLDEATYCSAGVCTFIDTVTSPSSFTSVTASSSIFSPIITFWPGNVTLSPSAVDNCNYAASYNGEPFGSGGSLTSACPFTAGKVNFFAGTLSYASDYQPLSFTYYSSPATINQPVDTTVATGTAPMNVHGNTTKVAINISGKADTSGVSDTAVAPQGGIGPFCPTCLTGPNLNTVGGIMGLFASGLDLTLHSLAWFASSQTTKTEFTSPFSHWLNNLTIYVSQAPTTTVTGPVTLGIGRYGPLGTTPQYSDNFFNLPLAIVAQTVYQSDSNFQPEFISAGSQYCAWAGGPASGGGLHMNGYSAQIIGSTSSILGNSFNGGTVATGATVYTGPSMSNVTNNPTENLVQVPMPWASGGTINNLCLTMYSPANGAGGPLTFTFDKNGAGQSLSKIIPASSITYADYCDADPTHAVSMAQFDLMDVCLVNGNGSAASGQINSFSMEAVPGGSSTYMIIFGSNAVALPGESSYYGAPFTNYQSTSTTNNMAGMPRAVAAKVLACYVTAAPAVNPYTVTLLQNGSPGNLTISIPPTAPAGCPGSAYPCVISDTTVAHQMNFANKDRVGMQYTGTTGGTAPAISSCVISD